MRMAFKVGAVLLATAGFAAAEPFENMLGFYSLP